MSSMEGKSPDRKRRIRVHREFECSRIEQAMLAVAYRAILPEAGLHLVERGRDVGDACDEFCGATSYEDTTSVSNFATAKGGQ